MQLDRGYSDLDISIVQKLYDNPYGGTHYFTEMLYTWYEYKYIGGGQVCFKRHAVTRVNYAIANNPANRQVEKNAFIYRMKRYQETQI